MSPKILQTNKFLFIGMRKFISIFVLIAFVGTSIKAPAYAQMIDPMPHIPTPGTMVNLSPEYTPAYLKGIIIHPENALKFDFIVYKGDKPFSIAQKRQEYTRLMKYFLVSMAVPDDDQWVNLSPYEKNRIIKDDFGKTEMGRDLLAQDYLLKQITSSLIYPESNLGRKFWDTVYSRAYKEFGSTQVPVNTFNKVWIVPDDAVIYEKGNMAYVVKNHLRVMLEEDYLSLQKHTALDGHVVSKIPNTHSLASKIIKAIVLPELEREVNEDKNFAPLRQVYSGMLLAAWYKRELKESLLGQVYANKNKVRGEDQNPQNNEFIYRQYLRAFKKGVFNFIREDVDKYTNEVIPRKYFSGGTEGYAKFSQIVHQENAMTAPEQASEAMAVNKEDIVQAQADEINAPRQAMMSKAEIISKMQAAVKEATSMEKQITTAVGLVKDLHNNTAAEAFERKSVLVRDEIASTITPIKENLGTLSESLREVQKYYTSSAGLRGALVFLSVLGLGSKNLTAELFIGKTDESLAEYQQQYKRIRQLLENAVADALKFKETTASTENQAMMTKDDIIVNLNTAAEQSSDISKEIHEAVMLVTQMKDHTPREEINQRLRKIRNTLVWLVMSLGHVQVQYNSSVSLNKAIEKVESLASIFSKLTVTAFIHESSKNLSAYQKQFNAINNLLQESEKQALDYQENGEQKTFHKLLLALRGVESSVRKTLADEKLKSIKVDKTPFGVYMAINANTYINPTIPKRIKLRETIYFVSQPVSKAILDQEIRRVHDEKLSVNEIIIGKARYVILGGLHIGPVIMRINDQAMKAVDAFKLETKNDGPFGTYDPLRKVEKEEKIHDLIGLQTLVKSVDTLSRKLMVLYASGLKLNRVSLADAAKYKIQLDMVPYASSRGMAFKIGGASELARNLGDVVIYLEGNDEKKLKRNIAEDYPWLAEIVHSYAYPNAVVGVSGQDRFEQWIKSLGLTLVYEGSHPKTHKTLLLDASTGKYEDIDSVPATMIYRITAQNLSKFQGRESSLEARTELLLRRIEYVTFSGDKAMARANVQRGLTTPRQTTAANLTIARNGGIDLNAANLRLEIKRDGRGVPLPIAQQDLKNIHLTGLIPIILSIKPAASSPLVSQILNN